jgi:hypothetical protein
LAFAVRVDQLVIEGLAVIVCHERERLRGRVVRNCLTDEGRPFGTGLQELVPNHLRRLWLSAMVVSAEGKGLARPGQVSGKKKTAKEPLLKCRNQLKRFQNRGVITTAGQATT